MTCIAFSSALVIGSGRNPCNSTTTPRRGTKVCDIAMTKKVSKRAKSDSGDQLPEPSNSFAGSPPPPVSAEEMLRKDLEVIREKRRNAKPREDKVAPLDAVKSAIDAVLVWNFFLVLGLLGWLVVALIPHFAAKNDVLLDPWLWLWQPFIQPVLGVLMLGTVVQGTISFINSKE